jgi:integrase
MDQLKAIFNPDTFLPWVKYGNGGQINPYKLLIPCLLVVSAARLEEICGLRTVDVQGSDVDSVVIDITPHDQRDLKNASSDRFVPVLPVIAGYLLKHKKATEKKDTVVGQGMLFPYLSKAHDKWSHNFGKQWGRYIRNKVGIKDPQISPAHSFRHTIIDLLYKAKVNFEVIRALDGHAPGGGESGGRYAKGHLVQTLREDCFPVIERALDGVLGPLMDAL